MRRLILLLIVVAFVGGASAAIYFVWLKPSPPSETTTTTEQTAEEEEEDDSSKVKMGSLAIESEPSGIEVKLDGILTRKRTPVTFDELEVGPHVVELFGDNVYRWWLEVEVEADQSHTVRALLVERDSGITVRAGQQPKLGFRWKSTVPEQGQLLTAAEIAELTAEGTFEIRMLFDPKLDVSTINSDSVQVMDAVQGQVLKSTIGYTALSGELLIRVDPADQISESGRYEVILNAALTSEQGKPLGTRVAWSFGVDSTDDLLFDTAKREVTDASDDQDVPASTPVSSALSAANTEITTTPVQRDAERRTELAEVARALEAYLALQGNYPRLEQEGDLLSVQNSLVPNLLLNLPSDPLAESEATLYRYQSTGAGFTLKAALEAPGSGETAVLTLYDARRTAAGATDL